VCQDKASGQHNFSWIATHHMARELISLVEVAGDESATVEKHNKIVALAGERPAAIKTRFQYANFSANFHRCDVHVRFGRKRWCNLLIHLFYLCWSFRSCVVSAAVCYQPWAATETGSHERQDAIRCS
jgi:hypothetical protein